MAESREILFHHPFPLTDSPKSGSQLRPTRMIAAFEELGYRVEKVTGFTPERTERMRSVRRDIERGRRFEFCYSESVNSPTALSDPNHLPTHALADPAFFWMLRGAGVPRGLFYRDVHWRFDQYRQAVSVPKRLVAEAFYRFDLLWYRRLVDVLYLPHLTMAEAVPASLGHRVAELPPGCTVHGSQRRRKEACTGLRVGYVGSIMPPHNDISNLLGAVHETPGAELTISFPRGELAALSQYPPEWIEGVELLHLEGEHVADVYAEADVLALVYEPHPYRAFAMPVKLFEAMGYGVPCLADRDTAAGEFVESRRIGWTVGGETELRSLLAHLVDDPTAVEKRRTQVLGEASANTWARRAQQVVDDLC